MKAIAVAVAAMALQADSAEAFVCHGRYSLSGDETTESLLGDQDSIECLVDNILSRELAGFDLRANDTVSTEMVSANIGASEGHPEISYAFNYTVWAEKFDLLARLWVDESDRFKTLAALVKDEISSRVCANDTGEASYFAAGGKTHINITLICIDGMTKVFHEELVSFEIASCEAA